MSHSIAPIIIVLAVAFGIYRRTKRTIGFQRLVKGRMTVRMVLFGVIGVLLLLAGIVRPEVYLFDIAGIIAGAVLAYYAMRTTVFERRGDKWFYRPNPWIGVVLLVLFFGRLAYRLYVDYTLLGDLNQPNPATDNQAQLAQYSHDPLTTTVLFAWIAYYMVYYVFVIRKEKHLVPDQESMQ